MVPNSSQSEQGSPEQSHSYIVEWRYLRWWAQAITKAGSWNGMKEGYAENEEWDSEALSGPSICNTEREMTLRKFWIMHYHTNGMGNSDEN